MSTDWLDWLEAEPTTTVADELAVEVEEVGDIREAGDDLVEFEVGGWATVDEDEEFLETGPPDALEVLGPAPSVLVEEAVLFGMAPVLAAAACEPSPLVEVAVLLGVAPVLAAAACDPAEIGGELALISIDWVGPKQTLSLGFGTNWL